MAGHSLLETARDALFLASLSARRLPWVYLLIAVGALFLTTRQHELARRIPARNELTAWLLFAAFGTLAFWLAIFVAGPWIYYAVYVWSGVLATLVIVRFWTLLGGLFTVTQAKRIYAFVGAGSVAGAIVGSGAALALAEVVPAQHLVLAAAAVFLAATVPPRFLEVHDTADGNGALERMGDVARAARAVWLQPYLRRVAGLILAATVTFTFVDFVFKSAADRYIAPQRLEEFFSSVYLALNLASLLVQLLLVPRLLRWVGVNGALAVVPAVLLTSAVGLAAGGGLTLALVLKSGDGALRHSLYRTGAEVLFFPISPDLRARVKSVVDVIGQRGGQALGSVLILMVLSVSAREATFATLTALSALAWLVLALTLRGHYLRAFREQLQEERTTDQVRMPALDLASLETLLSTLNDPDENRVLAALDVLSAQGKAGVIPALILYHPSGRVVERALTLMTAGGRDDFSPLLDRLEAHADPRVRAAALRTLGAVHPDRGRLERAAADVDPGVSATALVARLSHGWADPVELASLLDGALRSGAWEVTRAVAGAAAAVPAPAVEDALIQLAGCSDDETSLAAVRAMREAPSPRYFPALLGLLARHSVRAEARASLITLGSSALARLADELADEALDPRVRKHVPRAIAAFRTTQAAALLLRRLDIETDGLIRYRILRALGRWRVDQPMLPLPRAPLERALEWNLRAGLRLLAWRRELAQSAIDDARLDSPLHRALSDFVRDKQAHALERAFRLLNLIQDDDDFRRIFLGFQSPSPVTRASSRELVELLVLPPLREALLQIVDDLTGDGRVVHTVKGTRPYRVVLQELAEAGFPTLSVFAAARIGQLDPASVTAVVPRPSGDERATPAARPLGER